MISRKEKVIGTTIRTMNSEKSYLLRTFGTIPSSLRHDVPPSAKSAMKASIPGMPRKGSAPVSAEEMSSVLGSPPPAAPGQYLNSFRWKTSVGKVVPV